MKKFDKEYYENNNYASYLERKERYERLCEELHYDLFRKIGLDFTNEPVIDWGCAVGFLVNGLKKAGFKNVQGYDVSEWAVNWGRENLGLNKDETTNDHAEITSSENWFPSLMVALDVFEHMNVDDVCSMLELVQPKHLLVRIPVTLQDGGKYVLDVSEKDPTHVTRLTKESWVKKLDRSGYQKLFDVKLGLIYDTSGVMCSFFRSY